MLLSKKKLIWFLDDGIEENKISKPKNRERKHRGIIIDRRAKKKKKKKRERKFVVLFYLFINNSLSPSLSVQICIIKFKEETIKKLVMMILRMDEMNES
jgi:hypothetical protein